MLAFAIMVLWLYKLPLSTEAIGSSHLALCYLLAVGICFFIAAWLPSHWLGFRVKVVAIIGVVTIGISYAFIPKNYALLMVILLAVFSTIVHGFIALTLKKTPLTYPALGIILGNLSVYLLEFIHFSYGVFLVSLLYVALYWLTPRNQKPYKFLNKHYFKHLRPIVFFMPFLFLFEVLAGIMYGQIWPQFLQNPTYSGLEILPYIIAIAFGSLAIPRKPLWSLVLACVFAIGCYLFWFGAIVYPSMTAYSLYMMMFAAGIIDIFVIALVRSQNQYFFRNYALLQAIVLMGISTGSLIIAQFTISHTVASLIALVVVNISVIALYSLYGLSKNRAPAHPPNRYFTSPNTNSILPVFQNKQLITRFYVIGKQKDIDKKILYVSTGVKQSQLKTYNNTPLDGSLAQDTKSMVLPEFIVEQLSQQECEVLAYALNDITYKGIADEMGISESSVKTYMQRVYKKLAVYNKEQIRMLISFENS